jgi:TM2 domain-containing membrane protein YozV
MSKKVTITTNPLLAAALAYLVPGAGHFYLGRKVRGIIIFLVIGGTFWTGMAIGGPLTMDYYNDRIWFFAQMCNGVHGLYGWHRQKSVYDPIFDDIAKRWDITDTKIDGKDVSARENASRRYARGVSDVPLTDEEVRQLHVPEIVGEVELKLQKDSVALALMPTLNVARPYAGIAGMLNLLCIMDAVVLSFMGVYGEPTPEPPRVKEEAA